jgi:ABC-2 type transport system permease protein
MTESSEAHARTTETTGSTETADTWVHTDAPLTEPGANQGLFEVFRRRYLLKLLVRREISARYSGSFLGLIWSYINPLSQLFIYWFVMGQILNLHKNVPNFAIHVFAGLIVVHFFTETFNAGTRSIVRNRQLVVKMALPREMFPVASMLVSLYHVLPQMVILTGVCLLNGWTPDAGGVVAILIALCIIMLLGTALALMFSVANVFFRDFSSAVNIMTNFVRFGVPMIYPYSLVDERFGSAAQYYLYNPIANAVLLFQRAFWVGTTENPAETAATNLPPHLYSRGLAMIVASAVLLVLAQLVFNRLQNKIPEML